jgi:lysophospholipase L1-like esterase
MDLTLVGHSFVRRLRDNALAAPQQRPRCSTGPQRHGDVLPGQTERAQQLAQALQLDNYFSAVYTVAEGVIFLDDIISFREHILVTQPKVMLVDIGSNDIARYSSFVPRKMLQLAHTLHEYLQSLPVPLTVVNAVLPRTASLAGSPETFRDNSQAYNKYLSEMISLTPAITFSKMRGFQYVHKLGQDLPRPVSEWSEDGIHCSTTSMTAYKQRIRHSILDNCHKIQRL